MRRAGRLKGCIENLLATAEVECIPVIDEDYDSVTAVRHIAPEYIFNETRQGAINCWNMGLAKARGDFIVFAGDDLWFTDGWLAHSLRAHETLGDYGLIGFNDKHYDGNVLATHYIADRKFIKEVLGGRIAFPMFRFYCNDTVANTMAKNAGKYVWCQEAVVRHDHTSNGRREADSLDAENTGVLGEDIESYYAWVKRGAKIEWESVL
jgi:glycosyltransferase involved in cell wall biosynthesis